MGGMDIDTCRNIAQRWNKPLSTVMNMPLEQVVVFRRGSAPFVSRRYQTFDDPLYKELFEERETPRKKIFKKN
jgi:type IV secretory pathway TraG/TraD family ATPase VirD4